MLRHTCATELFNRGLNAKQLQTWLGHHSAAFTLSVYVHMLSDELPDADFWDTPGVPSVSPPGIYICRGGWDRLGCGLNVRLRGRDSNPDYLIQSQASYH